MSQVKVIRATQEPNLMQFFTYSHLPPKLQVYSKPFADLAEQIQQLLPDNAERSAALRHLLEAKDCAVRSTLYRQPYMILMVPVDPAEKPTQVGQVLTTDSGDFIVKEPPTMGVQPDGVTPAIIYKGYFGKYS